MTSATSKMSEPPIPMGCLTMLLMLPLRIIGIGRQELMRKLLAAKTSAAH